MTQALTTTPAADGFWMPAEFEPHAGCWLLWPERPDNWREAARPAQHAFAAVAAAIVRVRAGHRRCQLQRVPGRPRIARPPDTRDRDVPRRLLDAGCGSDVRGGPARRRAGVDWHFNAWGGLEGGLYFPWDQDDLVARKVLEIEGPDRYRAPVVNEGGAIHADGEGTVLITEQCLLNLDRNPRCAASGRILSRDYLNVTGRSRSARASSMTRPDGDMDNLACFIRPGRDLSDLDRRQADPQYPISLDVWERLHDEQDAKGRRLKVTVSDAGSSDTQCQGGERHHPSRGHEAARGRRASCRELR